VAESAALLLKMSVELTLRLDVQVVVVYPTDDTEDWLRHLKDSQEQHNAITRAVLDGLMLVLSASLAPLDWLMQRTHCIVHSAEV
jgi:hypothetical protein